MRLQISRRERIERIRTLPDELAAALAGLDDAALDTPYRDDGWTVRQVAHHVADAHMNAYLRVKLILTEAEPQLKTWSQDDWATLPDAATAPVGYAVDLLRALHARLTLTFEQLSGGDWTRTGQHPEQGPITLDALLDLYAWHGRHHIEQITALRRRKGW
ncbi:MAG TPA: putative metal-dependent hydrolase [Longimicrobiaceae bacterium]|jgi:uncharacterized damage-inducible protein DinB|nr:putative metal-dependent hydrolase [Longimicrobiaceae bacterium]